MKYRDLLHDFLLPKLCCVKCRDGEIEILEKPFSEKFTLFRSADYSLKCKLCGEAYPVTDDDIPIMWTDEIKSYLHNEGQKKSAIHANITVYDNVTQNYWEHTRTEPVFRNRIRNAVTKLIDKNDGNETFLTSKKNIVHLDFGCGPGQVLKWTTEFGFQQVGLDVSINNLRLTKAHTNALVVCGDASCMPFNNKSFDLITEASVLHHIENWRQTLKEVGRIYNGGLGIVLDSEPSKEQLNHSFLARSLLAARHPVYRGLSSLLKRKVFHTTAETTELSQIAEYHHQSGKGFDVQEIEMIFSQMGLNTEIILSPTAELSSRVTISLKTLILRILSLQNPWNPKYGSFTTICSQKVI